MTDDNLMITDARHEIKNQERGDISVSAAMHPFAVERVDRWVAVGMNLFDIFSEISSDTVFHQQAHVFIDGVYIPRENWKFVYPKIGTHISIRVIPMGGGGGGKNPLRSVLTLAVAIAAPQVAGAFLGSSFNFLGSSFLGVNTARFVTGAVSLAGKLAINAIAPPGRPKAQATGRESPTLFLQGARNQITPFGKIPQVLGKHRMIPPMGARPFTETIGNDQYMRLLFVWGYGPLQITDLKIGETPLSEFEGVEIETRSGVEGDAPISLFSRTVLQNDLQVKLNQSDGFITRTTEADIDEISLDVTFLRGLVKFKDAGGKANQTVQLEIQYAPTGTEEWSAGVTGYKSVASENVYDFTAPGVRRIGASYTFYNWRFQKRIDRIVLDKASGVISVLKGEVKSGFDAQGDPYDVENGQAMPPIVPEHKWSLAKVVHLGDDLFFDVEDERDLAIASGSFENANDFEVTAMGTYASVTAGGLKCNGIEVTARQSAALRRSVRFPVPRGQYDVRIRRLTPDNEDEAIFNDVHWTALRSIRHEAPVQMTGLAMTALRIKATDQLNGMVDRLNGVVQSIVPDWDGEEWVEQVTSNPASLYRHVLQGAANARALPDYRIDLDKLQNWHETCQEAGREFNAVIDYQASVHEVLSDVAASGRASPSIVDGKWGVVEDKLQTVPVQHFTPRNSFGFESEKAFDDIPHAFRVRFVNREQGWQQDERLIFDDGYDADTATRFEGLELPGITDPAQIWKDGRYHIATARLRPEQYSFQTDLEHIVCTRGDLIRFTHDVPLFGLMAGRVKSVVSDEGDPAQAVSVVLDAAVEMEEGQNYSIRFRLVDGTSCVKPVETVTGVQTHLVFSAPFDLDQAPEAGDLFMFGQNGQESVELIVKSIEPQEDLKARITCVDAAPAVHDADQGTIPAYDSQMSVPSDWQRPPEPMIDDIRSDESVLISNADGSFLSRIVVSLLPPQTDQNLSVQAFVRAEGETVFSPAEILSQNAQSVSITGVEGGVFYDIRLRYVTGAGVFSPSALIPNYFVVGTTGIPSNVSGFNMSVLGDTAHLNWQPVSDIDVSHYEIRFSSSLDTESVSWGSAVSLLPQVSKTASSVSVPLMVGSYLIKAVDLGGRKSDEATIISSNVAALTQLNVVSTIDEAPHFSGDKDDVGVADDALRLMGADSIDDWNSLDIVDSFDVGQAGFVDSGIYTFADVFDLGGVYTSTLTADLSVIGIDLNENIDIWEEIDDVESWDSSVDPSQWGLQLQLRTTPDDPNDSPTWSAWQDFSIGNYTARGFQFRLRLSNVQSGVTPSVSGLSVRIDMPDRTAGGEDIVSDVAGSVIEYASAFRVTPAVAISAQDMQSGDYYTITDADADGFTIQFFDSSDGGISRRFDYVAKGYGQKS